MKNPVNPVSCQRIKVYNRIHSKLEHLFPDISLDNRKCRVDFIAVSKCRKSNRKDRFISKPHSNPDYPGSAYWVRIWPSAEHPPDMAWNDLQHKQRILRPGSGCRYPETWMRTFPDPGDRHSSSAHRKGLSHRVFG